MSMPRRRSLGKAQGKAAIHMISAWCQTNQLVLGQLATEAKSNEITAMPAMAGSKRGEAGRRIGRTGMPTGRSGRACGVLCV